MFSKTYKSTIKTIVRSPLTWAAVALMIGVAVYYVIIGGYGGYDPMTGEQFTDRDPRFVLVYGMYIQHFQNTIAREVMLIGVPLFCVIVSGIVLTRDWRDSFFEVEHAGNVKARSYFLGRFLAVFTILTFSALFVYLFSFHLYIFTRGGVPDLSPWEYIFDSNIRLFRMFFITAIPAILIFTGLTFLAGNLAKSGTIGTVVGVVYVLVLYLTNYNFKFRMPLIYQEYLVPTPRHLYQYWGYYDTEWFDVKWPHNPFSTGQMLLCLCILYSAALLLVAGSYLCVRRRKI